jgi:murein DD-endopeptidase MepM/ murein hydrolase activator NlpD
LFRNPAQDADREGTPAGVAALSLAQAIGHSAPTPKKQRAHWRDIIADVEWAPDLGRDIGSRTWWRGLTTLVALCGIAIAAWPGIRPVEAMAAPMTANDWDQARAQTITPLAWGADTGRRMAPTDAVQPLTSAPERPRLELTATLGQGDSFTRLLERSGVGGAEAQRVAAMVAAAVPIADIPEGTKLDIVLGRRALRTDPRPLESLAFRAALDLRLEFARAGGALAMDRIRIAVDDTPLRIRGKIGPSLYRAARAAGAPPSAIQSYLRVIAGQLSVGRDLRPDDEFDIIVAHRRAATGETEVGDLLYAGLMRGGQPKLRMLPWTVDGNRQWFEANGVGQQRTGMAWPVVGRITSSFGMRRHPILGYTRLHAGMDFGAAYGSPIYAVSDGTVTMAGYHGGHGRYVKLDHGSGMATGYAHMSRIAVASGQHVRRGQVIGYVGSTGLSTGPHLHYELYRNGTPVNPASVRFTQRAALAGADLTAFRARLGQMAAVPVGGAMRSAAIPVQAAAHTAAPTRAAR